MASPLLSVIIPVFNEMRTIEQLLERVLSVPIDKEVIVVDDGCNDGTSQLLQLLCERANFCILTHDINLGKGTAIRTGLQHATGKYILIQDGDLELNPKIYPKLLKPLVEGGSEIVIGTRFSHLEKNYDDWFSVHRAGIGLLNLCFWLLYRVRLSDQSCCYKVLLTRDLRAMDLQCTRFEFCAEVVAKAARLGFRFTEVPVEYQRRSSLQGKKIRLWDGVEALRTLWKCRRWGPLCVHRHDYYSDR